MMKRGQTSSERDEVRRFYRVAARRLDAARVLQQNSFFTDAIYLGGYTLECALKSLRLAQVPARNRSRGVAEEFRGSRAHDLSQLIGSIRAAGISVSPEIRQQITIGITVWSVNLRYDPGTGSPLEAAE